MNENKIAIYSANFGNYRNEIKNGIDQLIQVDSNIDYYFFTDRDDIKSTKWNVIKVDLLLELDFINSFRHTSKYTKFVLPSILDKYEIVIWIDTKSHKFLKFKKDNIFKLFNDQENIKDICFIKHNYRTTAQQEIDITVRLTNLEHKENGKKFLEKIKNIKFGITLPDTMCIVYKNNDETKRVFKDVYYTLIANGLRRDQNVIQYVIKNNKFENKVKYFTFDMLNN